MSESVVENDKVFVSLGSNLSEPVRQVKQALHELAALPRTKLLGHSSLYRSKPLDHADQPAYINAVAHLSTSFSPDRLLDHLQDIENRAGRVRTAQRWSSRTLDIDILLFGDKVIDTERLTIPHYDMHRREFVLYPLFEIVPDLQLPAGGLLKDLLLSFPRNQLKRLEDVI